MPQSYRAEKSGFAADAEKKTKAKWDAALAVEAMTWVSCSTGEALPGGYSGDMGETQEWLRDGYVLAKLADWVKPGSIKAAMLSKRQTLAFKQMEVIGIFLDFLKSNRYVNDTELFQTVDLYENTNMPAVLFAIGALGRSMQKEKRGFGVAESQGEKKNWTEEQLKAGQNIIGLQMGTNQGANASGVNMGKARSIMD